MDTDDLILYGGIGLAAMLLLKPAATPVAYAPGQPYVAPVSPVQSLINTIIPTTPTPTQTATVIPGNIPVDYGVNGGSPGNDQAAVVANYDALVMAHPNLANPNYQMSPAEAQQYQANYLDISQGVATWPGGLSQANLQKHWTLYGCAQKRIFLPLLPPSSSYYIGPPANVKAKGPDNTSSWIGGAAKVISSVIPFILGTDDDNKLNNAELQLFFTGGYIANEILPFYNQADRATVKAIQQRMNDVLIQYT